jgi:hypothetical protein
MIEIKSYLGSINIKSGSTFTLIDEYVGSIQDPRHIDGAIELVVEGVTIMGQEQWDLIDQLWIYIVNGLEQVVNAKPYQSSFPDSSTALSLQPITAANLITMTVADKSITYNSQELGNALLDGATHCLTELSRIMGQPDLYREELERINHVRTKLTEMMTG